MNDSPFDFVRDFLPEKAQPLAAAVSGGPDSMALCHVLSKYAQGPVHALTVNHALREESAAEAAQAGTWVAGWPNMRHAVLKRELAGKPESEILEDARHDRYKLLADYCAQNNIGHLFAAHHQDDQAETFLFRLAKGSGLDGLGAMRSVHDYNESLKIIRPLLTVPKSDLVAYCRRNEIPFVEDPSNENERFARVRLRGSYDVLEKEGLTPKRLAVTAQRLARARDALDLYAQQTWEQALSKQGPDCLTFDFAKLEQAPEETRLRVLLKAVDILQGAGDYGPRLERMEVLAARIFVEKDFKSATLAGCLFAVDRKHGVLTVSRE